MSEARKVVEWLEKLSNERNRAGMVRFGINTEKAFGVPLPS